LIILRIIFLTTATAPGITIMFNMKLTDVVNYPTNNYKYNIARSKSQSLEDGYWSIHLHSANGNTTPPNLKFVYTPTPASGTGNNKLIGWAIGVPYRSMAYDDTYH
jgi:hypothetical protein